jgi:hypothetical protein
MSEMTDESIFEMDEHEREAWALRETIKRLNETERTMIELRQILPWYFAIAMLSSFVLGLSVAKWWWGIV